jgi:hypothetical protein
MPAQSEGKGEAAATSCRFGKAALERLSLFPRPKNQHIRRRAAEFYAANPFNT